MRFNGTWWPFQLGVFHAFERDRERGDKRTNVIAPPGSGKTLMGLEMVARLGHPALVLVPNSAIQSQWIEEARHFGSGLAGTEPEHRVTVLTYASVCQFEEHAEIENAAAGRLAERGVTEPTSEQLARARSRARLERGRAGDGSLARMLAPGTRRLLASLAAKGKITLVCDESHHAAAMWGHAVKAASELLPDTHRISLTATRPRGLAAADAMLYDQLFGPLDVEVATPAIVREGRLAPYQELAWFVPPLAAEHRWLQERDNVFSAFVSELHADVDSPLSFPAWVVTRLRTRHAGRAVSLGNADDASRGDTHSWGEFAQRLPRLADAGLRFLRSASLDVPRGARLEERHEAQPSMDDWGVLLDDWVRHCLGSATVQGDAQLLRKRVRAALHPFGYSVSATGVRRSRSSVDRLLGASSAKSVATLEVLALELAARGDHFRGLVVCDAEQPGGSARDLDGVLDPWAATARQCLQHVADDVRLGSLVPLLISGRGLRCAAADAPRILEGLHVAAPAHVPFTTSVAASDGSVRIEGCSVTWQPRSWVAAATHLLDSGVTRLAIGTRAMLGEGWDAPCLNVVVDRTIASTETTSVQVRGRSLRLDPRQPRKVASNWDVVCVESTLIGGDRDYARFVHKHDWLLAPAADGTLERGLSHVHASLSTAAPPLPTELDALNRFAALRAQDTDAAYARWKVGDGYESRETRAVIVQSLDAAGGSAPAAQLPWWRRQPARLAGAGASAALVGGGTAALVGGLPAIAAAVSAWCAVFIWSGVDLLTARNHAAAYAPLPLERIARTHARALAACGVLPRDAEQRVVLKTREDGWLRCTLADATEAEGRAFADGFVEILAPAQAEQPLYTSSRHDAPETMARLVWAAQPAANRGFRPEDMRAVWSRVPRAARESKAPRVYVGRWYDEFAPAVPFTLERADMDFHLYYRKEAGRSAWERAQHFENWGIRPGNAMELTARCYVRTTWS